MQVYYLRGLNGLRAIAWRIYVYHPLVIALLALSFTKAGMALDNITSMLVYMLLSIGLTISIAQLSYKFIESRFLARKSDYAVVKSSNSPDGAESLQNQPHQMAKVGVAG